MTAEVTATCKIGCKSPNFDTNGEVIDGNLNGNCSEQS